MKDWSFLFQAVKSDKHKKKYTLQLGCCKYVCYSTLQNILSATAPEIKYWIRWPARRVISAFCFLYNRRISYYTSVILLYNFTPIRVANCEDNYFVNNCVLGMGIRCTIFCGTNVSMSELKHWIFLLVPTSNEHFFY